jgi:hypothetical protein
MFNEERPISIGDLAERLGKYGHQLVMPFSLVSELVPADNNNIVVLRRFTKLEEDFSLVFFRQKRLPDIEMHNAARDFANGSLFEEYDPYVASFHELWGERFQHDPIFLMDIDRTIGMRKMSTQIELSLQSPEIYHWSEDEKRHAVTILEAEQRAIVTDEPKDVFRNTVARWVRRSGGVLTDEQVVSFADRLRTMPRVSPGWRLFSEVFDQLVSDRQYRPTVNDVWDLAHVTMLPYVDAMTLDKNKVEQVKKASRRLRVFDTSINYDKRAYQKVIDLLNTIAP